jgi:hypothetical protein
MSDKKNRVTSVSTKVTRSYNPAIDYMIILPVQGPVLPVQGLPGLPELPVLPVLPDQPVQVPGLPVLQVLQVLQLSELPLWEPACSRSLQ